MKYVRCNYCDSAIPIEQVRLFELNPIDGVSHKYVYYTCPVCGFEVKSFVFQDDEQDMIPIFKNVWYEANKENLPSIDQYVLWIYENGFIFYECIDKDWDDVFLSKFLKGKKESGPITHWMIPEFPKWETNEKS